MDRDRCHICYSPCEGGICEGCKPMTAIAAINRAVNTVTLAHEDGTDRASEILDDLADALMELGEGDAAERIYDVSYKMWRPIGAAQQ